ADLRDSEGRDDPLERPPPGLLDVRVEVLRALAGEPIQSLEVFDRQPEEVAAALDQAGLEELLKRLPASALDVHTAYEVAELLAHTGWTRDVGTVMADGTLVAHDRGGTHRAGRGHVPFGRVARPFLGEGTDHFGDDVAGLLQNHVVANADVLPPHLV